jgi:flagellar assembly factor FliW
MPTCSTKYNGEVVYSDDAALTFPRGLFGFESETRFLALEAPSLRPLVFLQSLATPDLCFLTLPVSVVCPDYKLSLAEEDLSLLGLQAGREPLIGPGRLCLAIVTVQERQPTTANLMAPVVANLENRIAVQALVTQSGYSHRQEFLSPREEAACL